MQKEWVADSKIEIHTGIHITRRKQMNIVVNSVGDPIWTGASIFQAMKYCLDNEHYAVTLHHEGDHIRLMLGNPVD